MNGVGVPISSSLY